MTLIRRWIRGFGFLFAIGMIVPLGTAATVVIEGAAAVEDATLYPEDSDGNNGGGVGLFVGRTGIGTDRRTVIRFDTSSVDPSFEVTEVTLELTVSTTTGTADTHSLHRLTADWVEGSGLGTGSGGGAGGTVEAGSVTWDSREHLSVAWTAPGGDFDPTPSASATALGTGQTTTWSDNTTGDGMVADVQGWVSGPSSNFGWLIRGEETTATTARRYVSSEGAGGTPRLTLTVFNPNGTSAVVNGQIYR